MKNKKILTIDDLINFCQSNNFQHFSTNEDKTMICVQIPSKITMSKTDEVYTEGLRPFIAKAYHDKVNLNKSSISKETLESTLPSASLRPILANVIEDEITGEKDFGSHDFFIQEDQDGNQKIIYKEQPIGVIFGENTIEYDKEAEVNRVILHGYLYEGYCQDAIDILERRGSTDCSVELNIRELSYNAKEKVLELEDFYVGGLTLLGSSVKPGMAGSNLQLEDFSQTNNSVFSKEETNAKLIETLEKLSNKLDTITASSNFNINEETQENDRKEEKFLEENKEEILENENVETEVKMAEENTEEKVETADESEVETNEAEDSKESEDEESETPEVVKKESEGSDEENSEELEGEETKVTEEEACGGSGSNKKKKYTLNVGEKEFEFELSLDEKCYALNQLVNDTYSEADNCWYSVKVYEHYVVMVDYWNGTAYKQSYSVDGEIFSLSGSRVEVYANYLTKEEEDSLKEMRSNYSVIETELNSYKEAELTAKKEKILSDEAYSQFSECEEFVTLKEHMAEYSVEELTEKADLAFAKCVKAKKNFSLETEEKVVPKKANKVGISFEVSDESNEPYGDYFKSLEV